MTNTEGIQKFFTAASLINALGVNYETLDIPYDVDCPIKKGSKIVKTAQDASGDMHLPGATGITIGGITHPDIGAGYLIKWDHSQYKNINGNITFCVGSKITDKQ